MPVLTTRCCAAALAVLIALAAPCEQAMARASSGGYSRPSTSRSYSAPSYSAPSRRPSTSFGYTRPPPSGGGYATGSAGDSAFSRSRSADALNNYRTQQAPPPETRRPSPWGSGAAPAPERRPQYGGGGWWGGSGNSGRGWTGGGYVQAPQRSGVWDAVIAWSLLNALSSAANARYFQEHRYDPGYQDWRTQADAAAARDPALADKLSQLDKVLAEPGSAPPPPAPAAPPPASSGSGWGVTILVLFVLGGGFVLLWAWRARAAKGGAMPATKPSVSGSSTTRFRVGMTLPLDPSAFLLAAGVTKVTAPEGGSLISVEAIGMLSDGRAALHRLYLPGRRGFFQLHLGPDGTPDECRWFSQIDEVAPASNDEWSFWLDPAEGMIGWPQFQTKDGKTYGRVWAPGGSRSPPVRFQETLQDLQGVTQRTVQAMLYGGPTNAPPPAPQSEFILVSAVEAAGQAWVEIHAGIDINPAALTLPAVPLA
ncbi:MAG: DUF2491 family protein [Acetobacteraceae bacterium]